MTVLPILYSYRRCPYAMRSRMALHVAGVALEIREISFKAKPAHMLQLSPKGTVPVLLLPDGKVIEQSLDIMDWALQQHDPEQWGVQPAQQPEADRLIASNDGEFKRALDQYKYASRFPEQPPQAYRQQGEMFLDELEQRLQAHDNLLYAQPSLVDVAIFPFIRQFAMVDDAWFAQAPYPRLRAWLERWLVSPRFSAIMQKYPLYQD